MAIGQFKDLVAHGDRMAAYTRPFSVDAKRWKDFKMPVVLDWKKTRFSEANRNVVPTQRGIYAFTLSHEPSSFPAHGFIMYIGITGDAGSNATLRKRYGQYLAHLRRQDGRPAVYGMLERWDGDLFFNFVPIPDKTISLNTIEDELLAAIVPPVNQTFIKAGISSILKDAWS